VTLEQVDGDALDADGALPGPAAGEPLPTRADLVSEAAPSRAARGLRTTVYDVYTTVLQTGIGGGLLLGASGSLRTALQAGLSSTGDGPGLVSRTSGVLTSAGLAVAAVLVLLGALCRIGPVSLGTAPTAWWTPLPVQRRELLRPVLRQRAVVSAVVGAVICGWAGSIAVGTSPHLGAAGFASALGGGALLGAALGLGGYALVTRPAITAGTRAVVRTGAVLDALALAVVVALAVSAVVGLAVDEVDPSTLVVPALVAVVLAVAAVLTAGAASWRDVGDTSSVSLRSGAARLGRLTSSVLQADVRELGRALAADATGRRRRRRGASRVPWASGPASAVWSADWLLLRRQPRRFLTAAAFALVPLVVAAGTGAPRGVLALLLWLTGYWAATTLSEPARSMALVPAAARALPVSQTRLPLLRLVPVAALMALWGAVAVPLAVTTSGLLHGEASGTAWWAWALLGAFAGPGWAAAALRGALRPDPDLSRPAMSTAMGSLPPGAIAAVSTGPDLAVLVTVPVLLAVLSRGAFPLLLQGQVLASAVAAGLGWWYAAHRARKLA